MDEVRRRTARTLDTLREALEVTRRARDTARAAGREEVARREDEAIAGLAGRIAWLERQAAAFEERQARRTDGEEG
jgi:hypothetical protein